MDLRENQYIKFPIKLEQYLMEGTYRHIEEVIFNNFIRSFSSQPSLPRCFSQWHVPDLLCLEEHVITWYMMDADKILWNRHRRVFRHLRIRIL